MKRIKLEYLIFGLSLLLLAFTAGYFTGRDSRNFRASQAVTIETEFPQSTTAALPASSESADAAPSEQTSESSAEEPTADSTEEEPEAAAFPLELNRATAEELQQLPGIGPALAERIITFRSENGGFQTTEDLMLISGIGEKRYDAIKDMVIVEDPS